MIRCLIIGAGQLGSRHLQGLLKYGDQIQEICLVDPSHDALELAKLRASEIIHIHQIYYYRDWEDLPNSFDLVIVATNANVREEVVARLLNNFSLRFLILEKVLFTDLNSYSRISKLLKINNVCAWVNHPRRMLHSYQNLKLLLGDAKGIFQVTGGNWGLGCNGLHFLDLFEFLSGSKVATILPTWINDEILESKRNGFVEFTGTLFGNLENGSVFQINSFPGNLSETTLVIFTPEERYVIHEFDSPAIYRYRNSTGFKQEILSFKMDFQSNLTKYLLNDLICKSDCDLTKYEDAQKTHMLFINALLHKYNSQQQSKNTILPIT